MSNADKAAQQVQSSYFNDDVSTTEEYVSAKSPETWRSTSISGVEDWCSVGSGTTLDDFKSLEDDIAEEYVSEDSAEELPTTSAPGTTEQKKDNGKKEYAAVVGVQEPKGQKFSANIQPVVSVAQQNVSKLPPFPIAGSTSSAQATPGASFRATEREELMAVSPKQATSFEPPKYSSVITKTESKDEKIEMKTSYAIQTHIKAGGVDQTFTSHKAENIQLHETTAPESKVEKIHKIVIVDEPKTEMPKKSEIDNFPTGLTTVGESKAKLLSELEGLKSKFFTATPDTSRQTESTKTESKSENVSYGFSAFPSSAKEGDGRTTDVSRVVYSKEVTESHSSTSISFQQQSFGANRSEKWQSITPQVKPVSTIAESKETAQSKLIEEKFKKLEQEINESKEWIQLKIQEMQPAMTDIGTNLREATDLYQQHEKVLEKLQTKQSPVEELLRQADDLISNQKPRGEVYSAMAENLGLAWKDLNAQLEQRRQILEQAVAFFTKSEQFAESLELIKKSVSETFLPNTVEATTTMIICHKEERKTALSNSMRMLSEGQLLLERLCEVGTHSMGDSRPSHMQHAARKASSFVERHMEALQDKWRHLESLWNQKKIQLEQCLLKCQMEIQMKEAETWLRIKGSEYLSERNLGDSLAGSEILQHEHHKIENECKEKQEFCLKLVKSAEELYRKGNYAGEELQSRAYLLLSECTDLTAVMEQRRQLLADSVHFFNKAQTALTKLDQIEIQLTTSETPTKSSTVEEIANSAIQDGRQILNVTGMTEPGAQGIIRKIEELEAKRTKLSTMCKAKEMAASEKSLAFKKFCEKYDELIKWLSNSGLFFVQRSRDLGTTQTTAKTFVEQHESLQNDLRMKTMEVEALLRTVPNLVRTGGEEAEVVHNKSEDIKQQFLQLRMTLEKRILIAQRYLAFLKLSSKVTKEMDEFESSIKQAITGVPSQEIFRSIEEKQITLRQEILQVNNNGRNFLEDARKVDDTYLNMSLPCATVEDILSRLELRNVTLTTQWLNFQNEIIATKETLTQWENIIKESSKVIKRAEDLESKMFPVIPPELSKVDSILPFLENRMSVLLPQIKSVQKEMDGFLKKSQSLPPLEDSQREGRQTMERLKAAHQGFQKKLTDYQIVISMMTAFFKNFEELEKLIDMQESQYRMTVLPNDAARMETLIHDHDANKPTVMELFKFSNTEAQTLINKINEAEPPAAAASDREKISTIHCSRKQAFERAWEDHKNKLEQHNQICIFNRDMHLINQQIEDLNNQLASIRQSYGESLPSALHTSEAFLQFEKTIELLQIRIYEFVSTAERMMRDQRVDSSHVNQEIQTMQRKWSTFRTEVTTNRKLIDVAIEYYKTIEEAEEWLKEGSRLLISVARKSSTCVNESDAEKLKKEVQDFMNKGRGQQEERLRKISSLSIQLYGSQTYAPTEVISGKNRDMMESFSSINTELTTLTSNIRMVQQAKIKEQKEKEEIDAALQAAQAEAEAAKAAAAAAQQAAKLAEAAIKAIPPEPPQRPPRFIRPLTDAEINEGTKYTFECEVDGHPTPQVQWFKEGILVENNPDYQTSMENGICRLTIEETFSEDTAKFICRATNPAGVAETHSQLVVKEAHPQSELIPPHFVQEPQDSTVAEKESHQLECQVFGNPLPLVSWFKDDACIDYSTDYSITYNNGFCTLKIEEAHSGHQGRYTCRAINPVGQVACSANLLVSSSLPYERPTIVVPLSNVMARAGQKLRLECTISGQPEPQITWLHNSKSLKETRDSKIHFDGRNATLVITEAFPKDAGTYTIIARNKAGEAVSSCNVSVKGRLPLETSDSEIASDIEPAKPQVKQQLVDQTVLEGDKVRMDCVIVGQPEPEVIWYHNGKPVKESDDFQLLFEGDRCTLIIKTAYLEDSGTYKCVAINSGGEASSICQLKVEPVTEIVQKSEFSQKDILISVEKIEPPKFLKLLEGSSVTEGQEIILECKVVAEPKATIAWYKDGVLLMSSPQHQIQTDDSGLSCLRMPCVRIHDRGTYSVRAQNKGGDAQSFCTLVVSPPVNYVQRQPQIPPTFLQHVENQTLLPGGTARFETLVDGAPIPQVRWNFQGKPVPKDKHHRVGSDGNRHWLIIQDVENVHGGRYSAIAENDAGIATTSALLNVQEPPLATTIDSFEQRAQSMVMTKKKTMMQTSTISSMSEVSDTDFQLPEFPSFSSLQSQQLVRMEQTTTASPPPPTFFPPPVEPPQTPKFVPAPVEPPQFPKFVPAPVEPPQLPKFVPAPVEPQQPLKFVPTPIEPPQPPKFTPAPVEPPQPPKFVPAPVEPPKLPQFVPAPKQPQQPPSVPPKFVRPVSTAIVTEGEKLFLEAQYEGSPEPTIQWFKDDVELKNRPGLTVSTTGGNRTSVFIMKSVESDGGKYKCIASNNAGRATSIGEVKVKPYRESPKFKKKLEAAMVKSGSKVSLQVEVTGVPVPEVKWYRNGGILQDSPDCRISSCANTHTLLINEVFPDDTGCYMVVASNVAGEARSIADLVVEEEKSPDEEKLVTYQEFSSVQQKKEMYTKISMSQPPSLEPYVLSSETPKAIESEPVKVPSPPPMPAVAAKVWDLPKPEPFPAPAITEAQEPIHIPSPEPEKEIEPFEENLPEIPFVPVVEPVSFQPAMPIDQPRYFPSSAPVTSALSESIVKQSIMKFSQPDIKQEAKAEEKKVTIASKTSTQQPVILNGFATDSKMTTESFTSMKQSSFVSESKSVVASGSVSSPKPSQVPVPTKFVPKPVAPPVQKEKEKPAPSLVPVWKPKKEAEPKPTWKKVQVPQQAASIVTQSTVENRFSSAGIPQTSSTVTQSTLENKFSSTGIPQTASTVTQSTVENKFSSTGIPQVSESKYSASETKSTSTASSQTSSIPGPFYSTESSTTTKTSYSTEQISITKKYEMVLEHTTETISSDSGTKPATPKPIIKKDVKEGPKPKKEVVIEEEPVVGAEVKPPHFSKVRGAESLRKIHADC